MAEPGRRIGPYNLLSRLGKGAMGEVWRARDERLDREVALKLLPSALAGDPERRARMLREAKASAGVPHPNVVTLYDVFSEGGEDFLVMELVEGETLADRVQKGAVSVREALEIIAALADALAAAHERGILHRDIKSANVMLTGRGEVKVLDFGLAKLREAGGSALPPTGREHGAGPLDETIVSRAGDEADRSITSSPALDETVASRAGEDEGPPVAKSPALDETVASTPGGSGDALETAAGSLIGTPLYMAPEQLLGDAPNERTEVYSVGVVAYELLTGRPPYPARTFDELLLQVESHEVEIPATLQAPVAEIARRCLAKDPEERFASMAELGDALAAARERLAPRPRRGLAAWIAGAAAAAGLVAAALVYVATRPEAEAPARPGDEYVERALDEYNLFYNKKAASSLRAALKTDPDHPLAHAYFILFGVGDDEERESSCRRAEEILAGSRGADPRQRALLAAAIALEQDGPAAARAALDEADVPEDREIAFWRAELAFRARDRAAARDRFRALLEDPAESFRGRIYDHQAAVLLYFDEFEEAARIGRLYAEAFPGEADALGVYATTLVMHGETAEALEKAMEALRLHEGEDTLAGLAKVRAYRGELAEARAAYEKALVLAPRERRPARRAALAVVAMIAGDAEAARESLGPCLPGGEEAALAGSGPCLFAAGLVYPEKVGSLIEALDALKKRGAPGGGLARGNPGALADLLRAREIFFAGGCLTAAAPTPAKNQPSPLRGKGREGGAHRAPPDSQAKQVDSLLAAPRDFYSAYHVPFFRLYAPCEQAALALATGDHDRARALLEELTARIPAQGGGLQPIRARLEEMRRRLKPPGPTDRP